MPNQLKNGHYLWFECTAHARRPNEIAKDKTALARHNLQMVPVDRAGEKTEEKDGDFIEFHSIHCESSTLSGVHDCVSVCVCVRAFVRLPYTMHMYVRYVLAIFFCVLFSAFCHCISTMFRLLITGALFKLLRKSLAEESQYIFYTRARALISFAPCLSCILWLVLWRDDTAGGRQQANTLCVLCARLVLLVLLVRSHLMINIFGMATTMSMSIVTIC